MEAGSFLSDLSFYSLKSASAGPLGPFKADFAPSRVRPYSLMLLGFTLWSVLVGTTSELEAVFAETWPSFLGGEVRGNF